MEAAGIEPAPPRNASWLMARDFRRSTLIPRRFSPSIVPPGVPYCPPESTPVVEVFWRRLRSRSGAVSKGELRSSVVLLHARSTRATGTILRRPGVAAQ